MVVAGWDEAGAGGGAGGGKGRAWSHGAAAAQPGAVPDVQDRAAVAPERLLAAAGDRSCRFERIIVEIQIFLFRTM